MKLKRLILTIFLGVSTISIPIIAKQIITFFIKPYPLLQQHDIDHTINHFKTPGIINGHIMRHTTNSNTGIFGTYAGYLALSDALGQMSFPRKQQKETFMLLVTKKIAPIFKIKGIINNWNVPENTDVAAYTIERTYDPETNLYFWNVTHTILDRSREIPLKGIIIFADPKNIYIPLGATITINNPQLVLPPLYAKHTIDEVANAMYVLSIRQFFDPIRTITKRDTFGATHILS